MSGDNESNAGLMGAGVLETIGSGMISRKKNSEPTLTPAPKLADPPTIAPPPTLTPPAPRELGPGPRDLFAGGRVDLPEVPTLADPDLSGLREPKAPKLQPIAEMPWMGSADVRAAGNATEQAIMARKGRRSTMLTSAGRRNAARAPTTIAETEASPFARKTLG